MLFCAVSLCVHHRAACNCSYKERIPRTPSNIVLIGALAAEGGIACGVATSTNFSVYSVDCTQDLVPIDADRDKGFNIAAIAFAILAIGDQAQLQVI